MGIVEKVLMFLANVLSSVLANELKAWIPRITKCLVKYAVARLPEDQRARFEEEWASHVNDVPGEVSKLIVSLGFLSAAFKMSLILSASHKRDLFNRFVKRYASATIGLARDVRPPRRVLVGLVTWMTFTVVVGMGALIAPLMVAAPSADPFLLQDVLSRGGLFVASVFIAGDAIGRWVRCIALDLYVSPDTRPRVPLWSLGPMLGCVLCLSVNSAYCAAVFYFERGRPTEIPPYAYPALAWFICTVVSAGIIVAATEVTPLQNYPGPRGEIVTSHSASSTQK